MTPIKVGDKFKEKVDSQVGYEIWEYLGGKGIPFGKIKAYPMRSDRGVYYFTRAEIKEMEKLEE